MSLAEPFLSDMRKHRHQGPTKRFGKYRSILLTYEQTAFIKANAKRFGSATGVIRVALDRMIEEMSK